MRLSKNNSRLAVLLINYIIITVLGLSTDTVRLVPTAAPHG
ncbi:hypothetical protein SAMN04489714_1294 [Schaalia radingae]|uniref:Uncharacterized protein n=1 Tax=Schaalia radingae TaxID=131110 RepID=A0ABY0V823_9ACTO|nr:hypothetical protein SAMN04489714_1294 [Schaalia radingae]